MTLVNEVCSVYLGTDTHAHTTTVTLAHALTFNQEMASNVARLLFIRPSKEKKFFFVSCPMRY